MKKTYILFITLFILSLLLPAVLTFALPTKDFSENENRSLASMPKINSKNVMSGNFQEDFSNYINDQNPFRENGIKLSTAFKILLGQKEINDVYIGKDNYYFSKFTNESYSKNRMNSTFEIISDFSNKAKIPTKVMLIPSPGTILKDKLPKSAPYYDENVVFEKAKEKLSSSLIDLRTLFLDNSNDNQLYFRTDHHFTADGAYIAYTEYCKELGIPHKPKDFFDLTKVSENFYGTLYSKTLDPFAVPDDIYIPNHIPDVSITYDQEDPIKSPFDFTFLEKKDKYSIYFGGNHSKVVINTNKNNGKQLLLIKDSFANSFVPYLFDDFEKIVMIDLRYFNSDLDTVLKENNITDILFLYETSNLLTDKGILKLTN